MALAWAALLLPVIAFYILKIRLRRVPVSTSLFWDQVFEEKRPRSLWQHLRHLISLLCQLLLLGLLVLALGEPLLRGELLGRKRVVLIVDNSASMRAADVSPSRLDEAKRRAFDFIDALRAGDEMAVISAGTEPTVACGLTGHQRTLRDAVGRVRPSDGPTRVNEAVVLARRLLADHPRRRVVVVSDGCFDGAAELAKADDVTVVPISKAAGNAGITRFQARRSVVDPIGYEVLVEVQNASNEPLECRLDLDLEGEAGTQPIDAVALKIEPNDTWSRVFEKATASGGTLVARLNRADALTSDNEAHAILPRREGQAVTLVTKGDLFLEKVFQANALVSLTVTAKAPERPSGLTAFHRELPEELPSGPVLIVDPRNGCDLFDLGEPLADPIVARQQNDHPLMTHVKLADLVMPEARELTMKGPAKILAESPSGSPLLVAVERPGGKVLVLLADLEKSELPLQTAFPILATNALGWFSGNKGELQEAVSTGTVIEVELAPPSGSRLVLESPAGTTSDLVRPEGKARVPIGPLDRVGTWKVMAVPPDRSESVKPTVVQEYACNLADRRESDLRAPDAWKGVDEAAPSSGLLGRPVWFYLILVALGLAGLEWFLYQRRWIT
jgi:hypothetical protein